MDEQSPEVKSTRRVRLGGGAIATIVGVGLLLIFMIQNRKRSTLHFLIWKFTWPLWLLTLVAAGFGALAWYGVGAIRRHGRRSASRASRRT